MYRKFLLVIAACSLIGCAGGEPTPLPPGQAGSPAPGTEAAAPDPGTAPSTAGSAAGGEATPPPAAVATIPIDAQAPQQPAATPPQPSAGTAPQPAPPPAPGMERVAAKAGVGKKGSRYGGGVITEPLSAYFKTRDRMAFGIQIPHAMKLYHATNNRYPKDMAEFEKVILKPANITLPDLPDGHRYLYDPTQVNLGNGETGLMVERPE